MWLCCLCFVVVLHCLIWSGSYVTLVEVETGELILCRISSAVALSEFPDFPKRAGQRTNLLGADLITESWTVGWLLYSYPTDPTAFGPRGEQ